MDEYDVTIQEYIHAICRQIKWKNYHPAIGTELRNHIADNVEYLSAQGIPQKEALKMTLDDMGNPKILGEQLNAVYKPKYNWFFILSILGASVIFMIMYSVACKNFEQGNVDRLGSVACLCFGMVICILLCFCGFSGWFTKNGYVIGIPVIVMIICIAIPRCSLPDAYHIRNGLLSVIPVFICFLIGMLKEKKELGIVFSIIIVGMLGVLCSFSSYTAAFLVGVSGWVTVAYFIYHNWFGQLDEKRKIIYEVMGLIPLVAGFFYMADRKLDNILLNRKGFFVHEYMKNVVMIGMGENAEKYSRQLADYPLLLFILSYGYIFLILYLAFLAYIYYEIFRVFKKQQTDMGKAVVISVWVSFTVAVIFSVLLNLGIPLMRGFTVPLLDFHFESIIFFAFIGLLEFLDCFGNYIFMEDTVGQNRLFDIEDGKVIIYYK